MLIRASGPIISNFHLLTLGGSCRYCLVDDGIHLFDGCLTAQVGMLEKRLEGIGAKIEDIRTIYTTHLHPYRIGGIPTLKKRNPLIKVMGSPQMKAKLTSAATRRAIYDEDINLSKMFGKLDGKWEPLPYEEFDISMKIDNVIRHGDLIPLGSDKAIRVFSLPGHTKESYGYYIMPHNILVGDEGLGYYNGSRPPGPGGDFSLQKNKESLLKLVDIEIEALCLPIAGTITGNLVRKHLTDTIENIDAIFSETNSAREQGSTDEEIREAIFQELYNPETNDPVIKELCRRSFETVWSQMILSNNVDTLIVNGE